MGITVSLEEAMVIIGLTEKQRPFMYQLVRTEGFPATKFGRDWRIHRKKLEQWIESQFNDDLDYLY